MNKTDIEKFLKQGLTETQEDDLLAQGFSDLKLRSHEQDILNGILQEKGILPDTKTNLKSSQNGRLYILIALALTLLGLVIWQFSTPKHTKTPPPPARRDVAALVNDHLAQSLDRSVTMGKNEVVDIESLYNDTKDAQAFDKIIEILEPKGKQRTAKDTYYLAKSYAQKQQFDKAADRLKGFDFDSYDYGGDVQWLYALVLLKAERQTEAVEILKIVQNSPLSTQAQKAMSANLLQELTPQ